MSLALEEIAPGAIAYFDASVLNADPLVTNTGSPVNRVGIGNQFVCYKMEGQRSFWAPLTATFRRERLPIDPTWVSNGYGPLAGGGVYLQDGACTYVGPNDSFVVAAVNENPFENGRPIISADGLAEVLRVVAQRRGSL
ncbi:hypothetical protein [Rhodanobacter lindaniclasticus]